MEVSTSVHMITYNHVKYLDAAIKGVLEQKTTFPIELIISDDCSDDGTKEIIEKYQRKYPKIIKPILRKENLGSAYNWFDTLNHCKGKYIAICEGDDYWNHPFKLQKQVDFLENNPDFSISCHESNVINESNKIIGKYSNNFYDKDYTFKNLLRRNFISTSSAVYRNIFKHNKFGKLEYSNIGDWITHLIVARQGNIHYSKETMSNWRVHNKGLWGGLNSEQRRNYTIDSLIDINRYFNFEYDTYIKEIIHTIIAPVSVKERIINKLKKYRKYHDK